jgi:hypothetical protein
MWCPSPIKHLDFSKKKGGETDPTRSKKKKKKKKKLGGGGGGGGVPPQKKKKPKHPQNVGFKWENKKQVSTLEGGKKPPSELPSVWWGEMLTNNQRGSCGNFGFHIKTANCNFGFVKEKNKSKTVKLPKKWTGARRPTVRVEKLVVHINDGI